MGAPEKSNLKKMQRKNWAAAPEQGESPKKRKLEPAGKGFLASFTWQPVARGTIVSKEGGQENVPVS